MFRTLRGSLVLFLIAAGIGWWQVDKYLGRRDELLASEIRTRLRSVLPEWHLEFSRAEWQKEGVITLHDVMFGPRSAASPLADVARIDLKLDRTLLADGLQILVTDVDIHNPVLHVTRHAGGRWNCQDLPPIKRGDHPLPAIRLHNGSVRIQLEQDDFVPLTQFELRNIAIALTPSAFRQYRIDGRTTVDTAGALEFDGSIDLNTGRWGLSGFCDELQSTDSLLRMAAGVSPQAREKLQSLAVPKELAESRPLMANGRTAPEPYPGNGTPVRAASSGRPDDAPGEVPGERSSSRCEIPSLGIAAQVQVAFTLDAESFTSPVKYQAAVRLKQGVINNPALPVPLHDLEGDIFLDNSQIVIRELQAANRESRLYVDGRMSRDPLPPAKSFTVKAVNLSFGRDIRQHLPPTLLKLYEFLRPEGRFNLDVQFATDGLKPPRITLNRFEAFDSSILPDVFAYPVRNVSGAIQQDGNAFHLEFAGMAGSRPVTAKGWFRNPGPNLQLQLALHAENVPIDDQLRAAFATPKLEAVGRVIEGLRMTGLVDADVNLIRSGIAGEKLEVQLVRADVHNATLNAVQFPYQVEGLSGRVSHDPLADDPLERETWHFTRLFGQHGTAKIRGEGRFVQRHEQQLPSLDLQLTGLDLPIDPTLEFAAVRANPATAQVFSSLERAGRVDLENVRVHWSPDRAVEVALPRIIVKEATVVLPWLPYRWERVTGTLGWEDHRLTVAAINGWHGQETYLQIDSGGEADAAVLEFPQSGDLEWHLHLEDVRVSKLTADASLHTALHPSPVIAEVVRELNPQGRMDLSLGLDLKGFRSRPGAVTSAWNLEVDLPQNALTAGADLSDVKGAIKVHYGSWDGERAFLEGSVSFDKATAFGIPFENITGPFLLEGEDFYLGSPTWPELNRHPAYNAVKADQVKGQVYGGRIGLDSHVKLSKTSSEDNEFRLEVNLHNAQLRQWAVENGLSGERLYGDINGRIDYLVGRGKSDRSMRGAGWIQISPAQLYEAPVLNRVLSYMEMRQLDSTAFNYAYARFTIHDGLFDFPEIKLVGEALGMVGRGTVAFGEGLNNRIAIDFAKSQFRNRVPVVGVVLSALTQNSVGVQVRGTVDDPVMHLQPKLGVIDDALRTLLEGFDSGQYSRLPHPVTPASSPMRRPGQ